MNWPKQSSSYPTEIVRAWFGCVPAFPYLLPSIAPRKTVRVASLASSLTKKFSSSLLVKTSESCLNKASDISLFLIFVKASLDDDSCGADEFLAVKNHQKVSTIDRKTKMPASHVIIRFDFINITSDFCWILILCLLFDIFNIFSLPKQFSAFL